MIYKLYPTCIIADGINRSIIIDLNYDDYYIVPLGLSIFLRYNYIDVEAISQEMNANDKIIFAEYIDFLLSNDLIFEINSLEEAENFPPFSLEFNFPFQVANLLIDISKFNFGIVKDKIGDLLALNPKHIQLRFFESIDNDSIEEFFECFNNSIVSSIEVYLQSDTLTDSTLLISWLTKFQRITNLFIFGSDADKISKDDNRIVYSKQKDLSELHCGIVSPFYFTTNSLHITESQKFNTCLNRKLSIDRNGYVKNCPSLTKDFGNLKDSNLNDIIQSEEFQRLWHINKDVIAICKDCEFRNICTDCRAYIENPSDIYSKPLKCGYDPYSCKWEEWSINPLKKNAIEFYGMQNLY